MPSMAWEGEGQGQRRASQVVGQAPTDPRGLPVTPFPLSNNCPLGRKKEGRIGSIFTNYPAGHGKWGVPEGDAVGELSCLGNIHSEPGALLGAINATHQLSSRLPKRTPSVGWQSRRVGERSANSQNLGRAPNEKAALQLPQGLARHWYHGERKLNT